MPRMQVYLPEDVYRAVKERGLSASELLQAAVRSEVRRQELLARTDEYLRKLEDEIGAPSARQRSQARRIAKQISVRKRRKAG